MSWLFRSTQKDADAEQPRDAAQIWLENPPEDAHSWLEQPPGDARPWLQFRVSGVRIHIRTENIDRQWVMSFKTDQWGSHVYAIPLVEYAGVICRAAYPRDIAHFGPPTGVLGKDFEESKVRTFIQSLIGVNDPTDMSLTFMTAGILSVMHAGMRVNRDPTAALLSITADATSVTGAVWDMVEATRATDVAVRGEKVADKVIRISGQMICSAARGSASDIENLVRLAISASSGFIANRFGELATIAAISGDAAGLPEGDAIGRGVQMVLSAVSEGFEVVSKISNGSYRPPKPVSFMFENHGGVAHVTFSNGASLNMKQLADLMDRVDPIQADILSGIMAKLVTAKDALTILDLFRTVRGAYIPIHVPFSLLIPTRPNTQTKAKQFVKKLALKVKESQERRSSVRIKQLDG